MSTNCTDALHNVRLKCKNMFDSDCARELNVFTTKHDSKMVECKVVGYSQPFYIESSETTSEAQTVFGMPLFGGSNVRIVKESGSS